MKIATLEETSPGRELVTGFRMIPGTAKELIAEELEVLAFVRRRRR